MVLFCQIAILMGCAVLPHLRQMVEIVEHGLVDEQQKVSPSAIDINKLYV